ncbi:hypothetical protein GGF43_004040 [Coemansia sp. RSA 2618]|nr:hypothetical protein GGF43_004040 [Coemansia sp. RSA 2618]
MGDFKIIKMLSGCGVFAKGRLRSLHKLVVADSVMEIDNVDAVIDTYMGVIGNVLPGLTELRAVDADISDAIIALLTSKCSGLRPSPPKYENLQLLSLYRSFLTLTDMVRLLQSLPHLRTLGNRVSGLGNDFRNTNSSALGIAEIMRSQFNPLNHFFKRWRITNTTHFPENFVIASILLLADVCPGLETIIFDFKSNDAVEQLFKKMVGSKLYANCQGRLSVSLNNSYRKPAMHIRHTSCGPDVGTLCV